MNAIDEWLDSDGAKRDALKFKNVCYISGRRCGKTAFASSQIEQYLKDHPDAKIAIPHHNGHSYYKELINSVYGRKKSQHDDMPDAISYALKEFGIKQREERLKQAILTNERLKRMLNNSHYGICWPSELIDACERINRYRKEEESMMENRSKLGEWTFRGDTFLTGMQAVYGTEIPTTVYASKSGLRFAFHPVEKSSHVIDVVFGDCDFSRCEMRDGFFVKVHTDTRHKITIHDNYPNHLTLKKIREAYNDWYLADIRQPSENKETKDMSKNVILKNIVGSDIYAKTDKGSVVYVGRGESLDFEVSWDGELSGKISFVADDEPLSDELRKIGRSFIKKVIFNKPATIVFWRDGSKTIVKMNGKDKKFDPEKGLAMAIAKKCLGNEGNYYNTFTKFLPEEKTGKKSDKK